MKSFILFLLPVLFISGVSSQNNDLFIVFDNKYPLKTIKSEDATMKVEATIIGFVGKENTEIRFFVNDEGQLMRNIRGGGSQGGGLTLLYENARGRNKPKKVSMDQMKNQINCNVIPYSKNTNYKELIKKFDNVYLVDISKKRKRYKAKKILVIGNPG